MRRIEDQIKDNATLVVDNLIETAEGSPDGWVDWVAECGALRPMHNFNDMMGVPDGVRQKTSHEMTVLMSWGDPEVAGESRDEKVGAMLNAITYMHELSRDPSPTAARTPRTTCSPRSLWLRWTASSDHVRRRGGSRRRSRRCSALASSARLCAANDWSGGAGTRSSAKGAGGLRLVQCCLMARRDGVASSGCSPRRAAPRQRVMVLKWRRAFRVARICWARCCWYRQGGCSPCRLDME
jgi:hypothetical protein